MSIVTKKKFGNAVKRNKIKRRLKNIIYSALESLNFNLNYSYLLIAKQSVLYDQYANIIQTLFLDFIKIK